MRLHRFYVKEKLPPAGEVAISDWGILRQWFNVFKFKQRHRVILFDGTDGRESECEIVSLLDPKNVIVKIIESRICPNVPRLRVTLFQSLLKKGNLDLVAEKTTELGLSRLVPVLSDRSEKKGINHERMEKIMREASEQSGRCELPTVDPLTSYNDLFDHYALPKILFHPEGEPFGNAGREALFAGGEIGLLVGPEGGWSAREVELCNAKNVGVFSLGTPILRAETAAIVAVATLLLD